VSNDQLYKIAYEEAVRALSTQQEMINSLRSRAGLLFSSAAVTTSFLGAQGLQGGKPNPFSWLALMGFVGLAVAFLALLWPRRWEFTANPHEVIGAYVEFNPPAPLEELHRELAIHLEGAYLRNRSGLGKLIVFFQIANVLLAVEVVLWIIAIASSA
jgi:hypothetical protein